MFKGDYTACLCITLTLVIGYTRLSQILGVYCIRYWLYIRYRISSLPQTTFKYVARKEWNLVCGRELIIIAYSKLYCIQNKVCDSSAKESIKSNLVCKGLSVQ